jgi:hypothetical protein
MLGWKRLTLGALGIGALAMSCSVVNAPDDPRGGDDDDDGDGGSGAVGGNDPTGGNGGNTGGGCGETNTLENCGDCGVPCEPANASGPSCDTGTCSYDSCNTGFLDCDMDAPNGCEVDGTSDPLNCNTCGRDCSQLGFVNAATYTCAQGMCGWTGCQPGFDDCDAIFDNGCELPLDTPTDCGGCGVPCAPQNVANAQCPGGQCGYDSCSAGFQDCNLDTADGCESEAATDEMNCGGCNAPCNLNQTCVNGMCSSCTPGTYFVNIPFAQTTGWSAAGCCAQQNYRVGQGPGTTISASFADPSAGQPGTITNVQVLAGIEHACNANPVNAMDFKLNNNIIGAWGTAMGPDCSCGNVAVGNASFSAPVAAYIPNGTNTVAITHNAMGNCHEAITTVPNQPMGTAFRVVVTRTCP